LRCAGTTAECYVAFVSFAFGLILVKRACRTQYYTGNFRF
jgi:hypothetical protein